VDTPDLFNQHHKTIALGNWKGVKYMTYPVDDESKTLSESHKKRIDKEHKLIVMNRFTKIKDIILSPVFQPLQHNIYSNLLYFYKMTNNCKM
jgi:hypothetical protein